MSQTLTGAVLLLGFFVVVSFGLARRALKRLLAVGFLACAGCGGFAIGEAPGDGGPEAAVVVEADAGHVEAQTGWEVVPALDAGQAADSQAADAGQTVDGQAADAGQTIDAAPEAAVPEASPVAHPATCAGLPDGETMLDLGGDIAKPWMAYCYGGLEYLTLPTAATNYSQYTAGGYAVGATVRTSFSRVRLVVDLLKVDISDQTFATSTGSIQQGGSGPETVAAMPYGVAETCNDLPSAVAMVDLTGTSFAVVAGQFAAGGYDGFGSATYSNSNRVVNITGGGLCGCEGPGTLQDCIVGGVQLALQYAP